MAKAKETKATNKKKAAPIKKTQPPKATKTKPHNLSEEKVVDSDSEDEAPVAKSPAKTTPKSKEVSRKSKSSDKAVSRKAEPKSRSKLIEQKREESESEESSEEDSDAKQSTPKQVPANTNGVKRKVEESSEESDGEQSASEEEPPAKKAKTSPEVDVQDSSSEEGDESSEEDEAEKDAKKPVVKTKKMETVPEVDMQDSSSGEDESSEESEENEPRPVEAKSKETKPAAKAKPAAESKAQESSEEEESSSAEEREVATRRKDKPAPTTGKPSIESIPAKPFEPPPGYTVIEPSSLSSGSPFASDNFAGKQIWHIIAPSNVPLKLITEVALDAVKNSPPVLKHKGVDYILAADKNHSTKFDTVVIPSKSGYQSVGQHVDTTLQLQQKIELPNLSKLQADVNKGSSAAANIAQAAISDARPQPKGLRMRYKPPGFGRGDPGRLGSESESLSGDEAFRAKNHSESLRFPKALGAHGASERPDSGKTPAVEKSRQLKKRKDSDVDMVNGVSSMPPPESVTPRKKKRHAKERGGAETQGAVEESPSGAKAESKEEKARRKEMKRLKKEAKRNATVEGH